MGNRRKGFEVVDRSEAAFMRLPDWLPDAECCSGDAYGVYGCLAVNRHKVVGKGGAVNRN